MRPDALEGHEWSGTVVAVGPGVDRWQVGDAVVGGPIAGCGRCAHCQAGRPSLCAARGRVGLDAFQGAFARYKVHRADQMLEIPKGLSMRHAAPTEPLAVALHGITQAGGPEAGSRWLVTGAGPIGSLAVAALLAEGVEEVVVSEPHAGRRALCEELGARALALLASGRLPLDLLVEPRDVGLDGLLEAALALGEGHLARKVLVVPRTAVRSSTSTPGSSGFGSTRC